jgi:hypothetical protein
MKRPIVLWFLAIIVTLASGVYQRLTGPTHPVYGSISVAEYEIEFKLIRSHETTADAEISIPVSDNITGGQMRWRRLKSYDEWTVDELARKGNNLVATIPRQPAAGKVAYQIALISADGAEHFLTEQPVVIRFTGPVPPGVLYLHIISMFGWLLLSTRTGLDALVHSAQAYRYTLWTCGFLFVGGLIFGPLVQKYAFGSFWSGWPLGGDMTDNKTAVAVIAWIAALWRGRSQRAGRFWILSAAIVTILVYLIPHSLYGSELDYTRMN